MDFAQSWKIIFIFMEEAEYEHFLSMLCFLEAECLKTEVLGAPIPAETLLQL